MSTFAVTIECISSKRPIPGADRIEVARLKGMDFEFVVPKDVYQPGDRVVYFPVDSVLPADLIERLGLVGKLSGKDKNRVKTVTLRGQVSQGLVAGRDALPLEARQMWDEHADGLYDLAEVLGVTKYDPPEVFIAGARLTRLPEGQSVYDIESADRYVDIADILMDQTVVVTEKVEGSNMWVRAEPDGTVCVGQRQFTIEPDEDVPPSGRHTFHVVAEREGLRDMARVFAQRYKQPVTVYAECLGPGIQGNLYKFERATARIFDIKVGGNFLDAGRMLEDVRGFYGEDFWLDHVVPVRWVGCLSDWLEGRTIKEASNGPSALHDCHREGIVIKPVVEQYVQGFGRLVIKQRSPVYLAKSEF